MSKSTAQKTEPMSVPLDEAGLPGNVLRAVQEAKLKTFADLEKKTKGGSDWAWLEKSANDADVADLKAKLAVANEAGGGTSPSAPSDRPPAKKKNPKYFPRRGRSDYDFSFPCSVAAGGSEVEDGDRSRSSTTITIARKGDGRPGITDEKAHAMLDDVVLDVRIRPDGEEQGELTGMESEPLASVHGIVIVKSVTFKPETVSFGVKLQGEISDISLRRYRKHKAIFDCVVVERQGESTGKEAQDPDQGSLEDAA